MSSQSTPESLKPALTEFISRARWFGGKGRDFTVSDVRTIDLGGQEPRVTIELVTLDFADGGSDLYQVPLATYTEHQDRLGHAGIAVVEGRYLYDALHDREAAKAWLEAFQQAAEPGAEPRETGTQGLTFHRTGHHDLDLSTHSTLFSGEQSNSSVAFGDDALMKVFRRVTPGVNPDIEIHAALTRSGSHAIAELYGWTELASPADPAGGEAAPLQLAMLSQFLRTASDGWELALTSSRNLFAEADLHADEVGGDFAGEAHRLGVATAEVHAALADAFETTTFDHDDLRELAGAMNRRLDTALAVVPPLAGHEPGLRSAFDALAGLAEPVRTQRVHGDLHLGQTLRTVKGWKIVDFEGEPAKPLEERVKPDSPWRDVAGMLRSFDYAAHAVEHDVEADGDSEQIAFRAGEWAQRNQDAFLSGYAEGLGRDGDAGALTGLERVLLRAYAADKAVYETVYEARNRPSWLPIPLGAVARLADEETNR